MRPSIFNTAFSEARPLKVIAFSNLLKANGIQISMDVKGSFIGYRCFVEPALWKSPKYDCAVPESLRNWVFRIA